MFFSDKPPSTLERVGLDERPRHPHQEIADLLATALLRLRARNAQSPQCHDQKAPEAVALGFVPDQSVNANPSQRKGENA